jgi:hypothetical protein
MSLARRAEWESPSDSRRDSCPLDATKRARGVHSVRSDALNFRFKDRVPLNSLN